MVILLIDDDDADAEADFLADLVTWERRRPGVAASETARRRVQPHRLLIMPGCPLRLNSAAYRGSGAEFGLPTPAVL